MSKHIKHTVMALLIAPVVISSVYSSTSREITFDVMQLEPKQENIFYGKLSQFLKDNSVSDGKEVNIIFETNDPLTVAIKETLTIGNYEIKFATTQEYQKENSQDKIFARENYLKKEQYANLIDYLAKNEGLNLRLYDKLKSLTLEKELLEEVSKFERIDKNNSKKLVEACLRTVKMNAVEMYKTVDDLVDTTFIENLCKTVGHMENVENLQNGIWFFTDIQIDDVTDAELYQKMCDKLNSIFG